MRPEADVNIGLIPAGATAQSLRMRRIVSLESRIDPKPIAILYIDHRPPPWQSDAISEIDNQQGEENMSMIPLWTIAVAFSLAVGFVILVVLAVISVVNAKKNKQD